MKNIAILASGNGSNFAAIAQAIKTGRIYANLKILITDKETAYVHIRAKKHKITNLYINPNNYTTREDFDKEIVKVLKKEKIDLVILAGYMRILSPYFIRQFKNRIVNIHPAILPSFKGMHAIKDAFNYGVKITGVTIHYVDEKIDHGPIILQESLKINDKITLPELEKKVHKLEHKLYPQAIKLILNNKLRINKRKVIPAS